MTLGRWLRTHRLHIASAAAMFYAAAIPITIIVFPDNSLWLGLLVICASLVQSLLSIADLLESER